MKKGPDKLAVLFFLSVSAIVIGILAFVLLAAYDMEAIDVELLDRLRNEGETEPPTLPTVPETEPSEMTEPSTMPESETEAETEATDEIETSAETEPPEIETVPSETAPPETAAPETEPPTQGYDPNAAAAAQAAENAAKAANTYVHALSQDEINQIRASYDNTVKGSGVGLGPKDSDGYNRNMASVSLDNELKSAGVNGRVFCSDPGTKAVAFSFQAGYEAGYTNQVLDILDNNGVKGTFYITHYYANQAQDIVRRMINGNHEVGSHTYSCPDQGIAYFSLEDQMNDAINMQTYMQNTFGYNMRKYNYNSGYWSTASAVMMTKMGYEVCFCSMNYADYDGNAAMDANAVLADLQSKLHPGCVYCFHMTNPVTVQILPGLIQYCRDMGYTITQLD